MQNDVASRIFLWSHRWFGLVAGLYFALIGMSGAYLAYESTFEAWLYPDRFQSAQSTATFDLSKLVAAAQQGIKTESQPMRIMLSEEPDRNATLFFNMAAPGEPQKLRFAYVDPSNYEFKGSYERLESLGGFLFTFHHDLFLGAETARFWMGIAGVILLILLLTGLWIWMPKRRLLKKSLSWPKLRGLYKGSLDLHKLFGIYSILLMITVVVTGLYTAVPSWFEFGPAKPKTERKGPPPPMPTLDFVALQSALVGQGLLKRPLAILYNGRERTINVRGEAGGPSYVYQVESQTLKPKPEEHKAFDLGGNLKEVHKGKYWSSWGKMLTFLGGLLPGFFYVTGFYVWFAKSRIRRSRA